MWNVSRIYLPSGILCLPLWALSIPNLRCRDRIAEGIQLVQKGFFLRDTKVQAEFLECIRCGVNAFLELKKLLQLITLFRDLTIDQFQLFVRRKAISKIHAHHKIPFGFPGLHLSAKIALK